MSKASNVKWKPGIIETTLSVECSERLRNRFRSSGTLDCEFAEKKMYLYSREGLPYDDLPSITILYDNEKEEHIKQELNRIIQALKKYGCIELWGSEIEPGVQQ